MKHILVVILFLTGYLYFFSISAQNTAKDSLLIILENAKEDSNKVILYTNLVKEFKSTALYDSGLIYGNYALQLAEKINYQKGIASVYLEIGSIYWSKGNYFLALENYYSSMKINKELGDKKGIAASYGNIGMIYSEQGNYGEAIKHFYSALKIFEGINDKQGICSSQNNIGVVYASQKNYDEAIKYFNLSLQIKEEINDQKGIANSYNSIGVINERRRNFSEALKNYNSSLEICQKIGNKKGIAIAYNNLGAVSKGQKNYSKAFEYFNASLKIRMEIGDKKGKASAYNEIGQLYYELGKYREALSFFYDGLKQSNEIGAIEKEKDSYEGLSDAFMKVNNYKNAYEYYKKFIVLRDSIINQENLKKTIKNQMQYDFDKKEAVAKAEQEKKDALTNEEKKNQKIIFFSVLGGLFLVMIFTGIIFRSLRITKKQKFQIELQKLKVEEQNNEILTQKKIVEEQKAVVEKQKHLVEEHQKEIIDSITYAKGLQQAILPPIEYFKKQFTDSFLLYKPKDIVAGDFYWMETCAPAKSGASVSGGEIVFIAAADCTGHGVPGAMVSVVCSNALNRAVKEFGLRDTGKILDKVTDLVLETFEKSASEVKDGMDISLLAYDMTSKQIQWSGANNPLWYIHNGQVVEIKADKQPVGKFDKRKSFTTHSIEHSDNSVFYLFTDGLPDQFGGPKGKKFMYKRFENNLTDISKLPMDEQQAVLEKSFQDWKGSLEQVDDVTVIGIKI